MSRITVGISDLNVAKGTDELITYALGSCVGICIYDSTLKIGGLSHIMLPDSTASRAPATPMRFADTAVDMLIKKLEMMGCPRRRLQAKIAGGAQMFALKGGSDSLANIGQRNVVAVKEALLRARIPIIAEDTGKNYGRTLLFSPEDCIMHITSASRGKWDW